MLKSKSVISKCLSITVLSLMLLTGINQPAFSENIDKELSKAKALMKKQKLPEALVAYSEIINKNPENARAYLGRGRTLASLGKADDAITNLKKATELDSSLYSPHVYLGMIYANKNQWNEAESQFRTAIEKNPKSYTAHGNLGLALMRLKQYPAAIESYEKSIAINDKNPEPFINIAVMYKLQGNIDKANEMFDKGVKRVPNKKLIKMMKKNFKAVKPEK